MSLKTGTVSRIYDIGSIQILKGISWVGEGVVKVRYRISDVLNKLSSTPFVDTDIDHFTGSILSSKFQVTKSDIGYTVGNALVFRGLVDSSSRDLKYLPDAYGGEIKTIDSLGDSFTVSALMQLQLPSNSIGGETYVAVKSDDAYGEEIRIRKRIVKSLESNLGGFQEVFNGATIEIDGYSYPITTTPSEVRYTEIFKVEEKTVSNLIVSEGIARNAFDEFVTSLPVKNLNDAYGNIGINYNIDKNETDFLLTREEITDEVNLLNTKIETLNYESLSGEWIAADIDHRWTTQVWLERGTYYYNFLVTRRRPSTVETTIEIQDPRNVNTYRDDFGRIFSVVEVQQPQYVVFTLYTAANKVSVIGNFNEFIPDRNLLEVGFDVRQVIGMIKEENLYVNNYKDWNRIDFYLDKPAFIDKIRFETLAAEEERQKIKILLDDKPISREEYDYISGRDLSAFSSLPIPVPLPKTVISEFDEDFDDTPDYTYDDAYGYRPDGYGYIDAYGHINNAILAEVLAENDDAYGLTIEERYSDWRHRMIPTLLTDDGYGFTAVRGATEYFDLSPASTQVTLRDAPLDAQYVEITRADHYTETLQDYTIANFDTSNRVITISPALEKGMYRVSYETTIYGGRLINNNTILEDARGNRYKYVSGVPATGAVVEIEDIVMIESMQRVNFQLSHYPNPPYRNIVIETLGNYARKMNVGITVDEQTLSLNSYLIVYGMPENYPVPQSLLNPGVESRPRPEKVGIYVIFYTNLAGIQKAEAILVSKPFNSITLVDTPDETNDIEIYAALVPTQEKLNVISVDGRVVTFNSPSQTAVYEVKYKTRDFNPILGDSVWISEEDGYGEWNYIVPDGYGDGYGDAYGPYDYNSLRTTVQKVSLLSRYESFSGNPRQHKSFKIFTNEGVVQTFTDFSLRYKETFEPYLIPHSLTEPRLHTNVFPNTVEYVTVVGADGTWELPITLYNQKNKISVKSEYFTEDGETISSEGVLFPAELFQNENPSIIEVTLPEPYIEPFVNLDGSSNTALNVKYGTDRYFLANIHDILDAEDGYGGFDQIERINNSEWHFNRYVEVFPTFALGKIIYISSNTVRIDRTEEINQVTITANLSRLRSILLIEPILITNVDNSNIDYIELTLESSVSSTLLNTGIRIEFSAGFQYVTDYILNKETYTITGRNESGLATGSFVFEYETPIESVAIPYNNFTTIPSETAEFIVGNPVILEVNDVRDKIRLTDLRQLQISFFVGEDNTAPDSVSAYINNYGAVQLLPDKQTDAYGNYVFDGYGNNMVVFSTNIKDFFETKIVNESEVLQTVRFAFNAASEQMVLGKTSFYATYQATSSICEVLVNGELKYRSLIAVKSSDFNSYAITVTGRQFGVFCENQAVYDGSLVSLSNPYIVLGSSPREYDQNIESKLGIYELRRYMIVPQNLNVSGKYTEAEVVLDDYDGIKSELHSLDFVIEYEQPQFPKRPKIAEE